MMEIMKASAGSGKTYNLAKTYIRTLLKSDDEYAYRHILAVTFTNKATAEMKSRILKELHILATTPKSSNYYEAFVPSLVSNEEQLKQRAENILVNILHDYGAFSISTIDKFFQQTLKAFAREIGQFSSYQVELDKQSLVHEAVERILDSLTEENQELLGWLNKGVLNQMLLGVKVNLEKWLFDMAERLKSDDHRELIEALGLKDEELFEKAKLEAIYKECDTVVKAFPGKVEEAAKAVKQLFEDECIDMAETNRGFMTAIDNYIGLEAKDIVACPTDAFLRKSRERTWFAKAKVKLQAQLEGKLEGPLDAFCDLFEEPFKVYNTALMLKEQAYTLGIAKEFYIAFGELLKEKNVLSIDDSNTILKGIIDGSDAPFVYEKLGVRYEHFLLDEFQDTSSIQWQNFLPLLKNSEASGNDNLVVGDVKQSIYRWRGSDWKLLESEIFKQFSSAKTTTLNDNYRSTKTIVEFNTAFFKYAAEGLGTAAIYADVKQDPKKEESQVGQVKISFCDASDQPELILRSVKSAMDAGAEYGDIAILVRNNKEGGETAAFLIENGIPVISDDSLTLKSSKMVRNIVSLLSCVDNPDDQINGYVAQSLGVEIPENYHSLVDLTEGMIRALLEKDPSCMDGEILYVQSFLDNLQDWCSINGQNLMLFLKWWAEKDLKLSSPADQKSVRIMTIHKSKGLEFPYVIFPYAENVDLFSPDWHWCKPDNGGEAELPESTAGVFPVYVSKKTEKTLFSEDYKREKEMQRVDAINTFYVALTRAGKSLHVIASRPGSTFLKDLDKSAEAISSSATNLSQILYAYARFNMGPAVKEAIVEADPALGIAASSAEVFSIGTPYDFTKMKRDDNSAEEAFDASFVSIPSDGRVKPSEDDLDFFGEDGSVGASPRLKGIVIHDILARIQYPGDLEAAVNEALIAGEISSAEKDEMLSLLRTRIEAVSDKGWFPEASEGVSIANELEVFAADGKLHRPDRVVCYPDRTIVIDYKTGSDKLEKYTWQVRGYMKQYREMGYPNVEGYLWYLQTGTVDKV